MSICSVKKAVTKQNSEECGCPPMTSAVNPPPPAKPGMDESGKYFHEVGAEMIGNQLIIRMEKDKSKRNKRKGTWDPPCDCGVIEIKRPSSSKGPRIVNGGDNNQILFRVHSKAHLQKKDDPNYRPQAVAYKINRAGTEYGDRCRKITVYPQLHGPITQEVFTDYVNDGEEDVYLLRVKKRNDSTEDGNKRNLEVELHTPKPPAKPKPVVCPPPPPAFECPPVKPCKTKSDDSEGGKKGKGGKGGKAGKAGKAGKKEKKK